ENASLLCPSNGQAKINSSLSHFLHAPPHYIFSHERPMKRRLKTLLALIAIFLLPTIWLLMSHFIAKRALEKYKAQLRAAGEKLTIAELQPSPIPPELNGAKLIERAYYMIFDAPSPYTDHDGTIETNLPPAMRMIAPGKA